MSYVGNQPFTAAFLTDTFSGNGSTVAFTMSVAPATTSSVIVAITGVLQDPSTYSVSGTTLTFSAAPPTGTSNISVRYLGIPASGVTTTAYRTQTEFTATAGQTTFSVPSYTVGFIDVYRNGLLLGSTDFTATNGTTVVLTNAASAGDFVETVSFYVSSVLNAIPATTGSVGTTYIADASVTQAKLGTGVAGNGPAFSAYPSASQSVANTTFTKLAFNTEEFDTANAYDSSTNFRFTPSVAGYYAVNIEVTMNGYSVSSGQTFLILYKNGSVWRYVSIALGSTTSYALNGSDLLYLNGTDYIEAYIYQNSGASQTVAINSQQYNKFQASLVRAA